MVSLDNYLNETTRHAHVIFPSPSFLESAHFDMWSWVFCLTSGGHFSPAIFPTVDRPEHWRVIARIRSEEHTSELQSLMRISYAVFCLKNKNLKSRTEHF